MTDSAIPRKHKDHGMNFIRQEKRLAIYLRDGLACAYCGRSVEDGVTLSLDHIIPESQGGKHEATNLITCCTTCNSSRGVRPLYAFADAVASYLDHETSADCIVEHIEECLMRPLDVKAAKELIARRGSCAKVIANL